MQFSSLRIQGNRPDQLRDRITDRVTSNNQELITAIGELRNLITKSVDNTPVFAREDLTALMQDFRATLADGVVTPEELAGLGGQVEQLLIDAGVTADERAAILAQVLEVANLTDREPRLEGELFIQVQAAIADGSISEAEKQALRQTAADNINEGLENVNQDFFREVQTLRTLITESIDNSIETPTREELQAKLQELIVILEDGLTPGEVQELLQNVIEALTDFGITASEAYDILLQDQAVAVASNKFPATPDNVTGTTGSDVLYGQNGNDTLTGASTNNGRGDIDILLGGAGADTFVLGNATNVFYDDGIARTQGLLDYALILDFDSANGDKIQLNGNAANYTLGPIPTDLTNTYPNLDGTAISTSSGELIGVIFGASVTNFSSDFTFI